LPENARDAGVIGWRGKTSLRPVALRLADGPAEAEKIKIR
jgi:hypothetical protein